MRRTLFVLTPLFVMALFLSSCKDSTTDPGTSSDKTAILTAKPWRTTLFTLNGSDAAELHVTISTFKADGTVSGPLANGKMQSGTWKFSDDKKMLLITGYTPHSNWVIDELTSTSLKVHDDDAEAGSYALKAVWHAVPN